MQKPELNQAWIDTEEIEDFFLSLFSMKSILALENCQIVST